MQNPQIDTARRLLAELAQMTEHATMTGSLRGGERSSARAFNGALETLRSQGAIPEGMFEPVDLDSAEYGAIGVQARLLLSVIQDEPEERRRDREQDRDRDRGRRRDHEDRGDLGAVVALAPFLDSADLAQMLRERIDESSEIADGVLTALAPFLDSGDLGELVRRRMRPRAPQPPTPPAPPEPVVPSAPPEPPAPDLRPVIAASGTLETLAAELRRPDISIEERQAIATRLAEIAYEQSVQG